MIDSIKVTLDRFNEYCKNGGGHRIKQQGMILSLNLYDHNPQSDEHKVRISDLLNDLLDGKVRVGENGGI